VWLPLEQAFAPDDGLGPPHGNDWLAWPCDDGAPYTKCSVSAPSIKCSAIGASLLPAPTLASKPCCRWMPLRYVTTPSSSSGVEARSSSPNAPCPLLQSPPLANQHMLTTSSDLADLLGDLSEAQMVALESPNTWLRRGERERASGGSRMAHPGGVISSNKAEATAAFYRRTGRPLPPGNGAAGGAGVLPAPAGEPCATVAIVPAAPAPATPTTTTLSQSEFDALVPTSGSHGVPLPPQFASRTPATPSTATSLAAPSTSTETAGPSGTPSPPSASDTTTSSSCGTHPSPSPPCRL
jgi:hypothetical protein